MMDSCRRCMWHTHAHTHAHTHSGICHVFVSSFIYFLWFFYTLQFVWEKWGDAHTVCLSSVYVVWAWCGWGMFSLRQKAVLWRQFLCFIPSLPHHIQMCIMYTTSSRKKATRTNSCLCFYTYTVFMAAWEYLLWENFNSMLFCIQCKWVADGQNNALFIDNSPLMYFGLVSVWHISLQMDNV